MQINSARQPLNVYFTVDTESSMGGAWSHADRRPLEASKRVFCRKNGEEYGIPLQVRMLKEFGFTGTFFVETLATRCLGESDMRSVFDFLLREEQDVQLHIHPGFHFYSASLEARAQGANYSVPRNNDLIGHLDDDLQGRLLEDAATLFEKFAGYPATAFRAGCFAGSHVMLRHLRRLGILVDSSFNPCYHPELSFPDGALAANLAQCIEGVWELPISVARTPLPEGYHGFKCADCTSMPYEGLRRMLDAAAMSGQQHFVILFHSFSTVKEKNETYGDIRPNRIVIRRLEKLFRYLAHNPDRFRVETMGRAAAALARPSVGSPPQPAIVKLPAAMASWRIAVQLFNRSYWI
jgi:hypothetical protein